jgi:hypothetical protein
LGKQFHPRKGKNMVKQGFMVEYIPDPVDDRHYTINVYTTIWEKGLQQGSRYLIQADHEPTFQVGASARLGSWLISLMHSAANFVEGYLMACDASTIKDVDGRLIDTQETLTPKM